ncbi:MAG: hypothetical protein AAF192_21330 [Pseudomonadota bacterium]
MRSPDARLVWGGVSALLLLALTAWLARDLPPPRVMIFAAGGEGGGYWRIAERYRARLARFGVEVQVRETAGSVENAALLAAGEVDVALLQGGVNPPEDAAVEALAVILPEPLLVFARSDDLASPEALSDAGGAEAGTSAIPANPGAWRGLRAAVGPEGSGARAAWRALEAAAGLAPAWNEALPLGGGEAGEALRAGRADLAVFVAPLDAPYLRPLFDDPRLTALELAHPEALARRLAASRVTVLPAGAVQLHPPRPAQDMRLLSMNARLAARSDLHPALVDRLVHAAMQIHGGRSLLTDEGVYPTLDGAALPADVQARDLIASGPSALGDVLPWWIAAQINRVMLLLLPALVLLVPLMRAAPAIYAWRMRSRVYRHYEDIRAIDEESRGLNDPDRIAALDRRLAEIDEALGDLRLPLTYRDYAYTARVHVDLVRRRLAARRAA